MGSSDFRFAPAHLVEFMERSLMEVYKHGLVLQTADEGEYQGRHVETGGNRYLNFGACSYLGLEQRNELKEGAIDAIRRYGTQFPFPRAYIESPLYYQLERALESMTGGHVLVASSMTAAHISALPVLVGTSDALLVDKYAHASLHTAIALLHDTPVRTVPHNRFDILQQMIDELSKTHQRVWYICDGLYSMFGRFAPFSELVKLLEKNPQLHLYVDDAHATTWCGRHGRGMALDSLPDLSRVVVSLSLNKAFSAAGGALVFQNDQERLRVRMCGGPMIFSGPIQPPMLGAALASAQLHLDPSFDALQKELVDRILLFRSLADAHGITLSTKDVTPIIFIHCGMPPAAFALTTALRKRGIFVCPAVPPAVPPEKSGLRITMSLHNTYEDIHYLVQTLAEEMNSGTLKIAGVR